MLTSRGLKYSLNLKPPSVTNSPVASTLPSNVSGNKFNGKFSHGVSDHIRVLNVVSIITYISFIVFVIYGGTLIFNVI